MPDAEQFHTFHGVTQAMSSPIPAAATAASPAPANPRSRVVLASLIGTTIEFYDFYVYATAAVLVFPHLFFPPGDPTAALLASFAVFGAAMVARPLGAVIFGHLGDKHGRKATLVGALLTMGIATFLIGVLPTYAMVGWLAPLLLVILRIAQGFALGGEWSGAALVATENAPAGKRAWYGTFPQLGAPIGFIIANGLFLVIAAMLPSDDPSMPSQAFLDWGWRIPFLFSVVMVIVGLWVRLRLVESTAFSKASKAGKLAKLPARQRLPEPLEAAHPRHVLHARDLRALLPDDDVLARLRPFPGRGGRRARSPGSATRTTRSCSCSSAAWCSSASSPWCPAPGPTAGDDAARSSG